MPVEYTFDTKARVVRSVYTGSVTDGDIRAHRDRLAKDPGFDPGFHHLADASAVTHIHVSADVIRMLAFEEMFQDTVKRAIVVSGDETYGLARMFQSLTPRAAEQTRVFQDLKEAEAWLRNEA